MLRRVVSSTLLILVIPTLFVTAVLSRSNPNAVHASTPGIVGSWLLTITPHGAARSKALQINTSDGMTVSVAGAPLTSSPPGSAGSGTWVSTGGNHFKGLIFYLLTDASGRFSGLFSARTTATVSGNRMTGSSAVAFSDTQGRITGRGTSTFTGIRTDVIARGR